MTRPIRSGEVPKRFETCTRTTRPPVVGLTTSRSVRFSSTRSWANAGDAAQAPSQWEPPQRVAALAVGAKASANSAAIAVLSHREPIAERIVPQRIACVAG